MPLAELAHVEAQHRLLVAEQRRGESLRQLRLADTGGPEEQEAPDRATLVAHPGAVASHGFGDRDDRVVLADDPLVQLGLEPSEALTVGFADAADRDAGRTRDHCSDLQFTDHGFRLRLRAHRVEFDLDGFDLVTQARRILVVFRCDGRVLLGLQVRESLEESGCVDPLAE